MNPIHLNVIPNELDFISYVEEKYAHIVPKNLIDKFSLDEYKIEYQKFCSQHSTEVWQCDSCNKLHSEYDDAENCCGNTNYDDYQEYAVALHKHNQSIVDYTICSEYY